MISYYLVILLCHSYLLLICYLIGVKYRYSMTIVLSLGYLPILLGLLVSILSLAIILIGIFVVYLIFTVIVLLYHESVIMDLCHCKDLPYLLTSFLLSTLMSYLKVSCTSGTYSHTLLDINTSYTSYH